MENDLQQKIAEVLRDPKNMGEMEAADAVGTVGNSGCGEMLRMWIKFKDEKGKKIIDRATFQSFGCETAIAVASLATELIRGKTAEEALAMKGQDLSGELGPLPPMKIHCSELVEQALRLALEPELQSKAISPPASDTAQTVSPTLLDSFVQAPENKGEFRIVMLERDKE
jgi:nitrogen fixation protein NifU and related proteins